VWKTRLPGGGFGSPILVGDRLFVVSEPAELLCIHPSDGRILWRQSNTPVEVLGEEKAAEVAAQYTRLDEERNRLGREENKLRKDEPAAKDKLEELRKKVRQADQAIRDYQKQFPRHTRGGAGNSAATPVSDGKHIAAVFGSGIAGVYTTEGKRLWVRFLETSTQGFGHSSSPVLVGDKLIVHINDLVALDLATGRELWRTAVPGSHASPLAARVGSQDVLVLPAGMVVRARDGTVMVKGKWHTSECTPVLHDGVLYVSRQGAVEAWKLSAGNGEDVILEQLWKGKNARDRRTPSSLQHDGLLYEVNTSGILDVSDARTGEQVYSQRLPGVNQVYSSLALAGDHLYVCDTRGKTIVFKAGRTFERVASNQLEGTGACPLFSGDRLFLRGQQHLYCLGTAGEKP
jgi:outer membrane protein assembly factor BamB